MLPGTIVTVSNIKAITTKYLHSKVFLCQFQSEMKPGMEAHSLLLIVNLVYCKQDSIFLASREVILRIFEFHCVSFLLLSGTSLS